MIELLVVCEGRADFEHGTALAERVCAEAAGEAPLPPLQWRPHEGEPFIACGGLSDVHRRLGIRFPHGHFRGDPGSPDAQAVRNAINVVRHLRKRDRKEIGLLFLRDVDHQPERIEGFEQARAATAGLDESLVVIGGHPEPSREAWILAGFIPETLDEHRALDEVRRETGVSPCEKSHTLGGRSSPPHRAIKHVVHRLTKGDRLREERCWREAPLELLRKRGDQNGLRAYLADVSQRLGSTIG